MNKSKIILGVVTPGQSPREDILKEMRPYWPPDILIRQSGSLDGLTRKEILKWEYAPSDSLIVTRLSDGSSICSAEKHLITRMQQCIDKLQAEGAAVILVLCTGIEQSSFTSTVPLLIPKNIVHDFIPLLLDHRKLAVIVPAPEQIRPAIRAWKKRKIEAMVHYAPPYSPSEELTRSVAEIKKNGSDMVLMDCMGYDRSIKRYVSLETGKIVLLARTLVARVAGELLDGKNEKRLNRLH